MGKRMGNSGHTPPSSISDRRPPRWVLPPTVFVACVLVMALADWLIPLVRLIEPPWTHASLITAFAGLCLAVWGLVHFRSAKTPIEPFQVATSLVTTGPYRFTRNPMYVGLSLLLLSWAIWLGSLGPAIVLPVFPIIITRVFICAEEAMLRDRFGDAYETYTATVRRWI